MTVAPANLRREQGAATRIALVQAARRLFADKGYHAAGTEDLVKAAGVTRGALYHHFRDKQALFEAVFRDAAEELAEAATLMATASGSDRWEQMQGGLQAHLRLIADSPEFQRILLLDGPAVFGWSRWRELQFDFSLGLLTEVMKELHQHGVLGVRSPQAAAHLVLAALNEAALAIAHANAPEAALRDAGEVLRAMVAGLRSASVREMAPGDAGADRPANVPPGPVLLAKNDKHG